MKNKQRFWKKHIEAWRNSGVSQAEYCREHSLSYKSFGYHKRRVGASAKPQKVIPIPETAMRAEEESRTCKPISLCVPRGFRIEIEPGFCQLTLKELLEVVAS
ncbi:IS66 family insertion sequence element accessory protein TnpA [Maridesulfovibrio sp.]|uniref:IS66 family insertion sequence element accessory protein TnpA n=1 Tax=Maridesulfovibrio sp. TaxID=2795000 RepID=UPI002A189738|nr:hypothetical protein [Maridesulfovibrio sp.]